MPASATERHLKIQLDELLRRHDTLTKRIVALNTDIGRELDSERKLVLQERRADLAAERDQVLAELTEIELRLAGTTGMATSAKPDPTVRDSRRSDTGLVSMQEQALLERQLAESRENLRLVEERKAEFVQETDIPLQLIKDERRVRERIADLEARLNQEGR